MADKSFEDKIDSAKGKLKKLMNTDITLKESMTIYKDGIKELKDAEELLSKAKIEYEEIKKDAQKEDND